MISKHSASKRKNAFHKTYGRGFTNFHSKMALTAKLMKYHRQMSQYARFQILGISANLFTGVRFILKFKKTEIKAANNGNQRYDAYYVVELFLLSGVGRNSLLG